jgi:hypothetical protein
VITIPAAILCAVFVVLAAVHVYWAFGGGQGFGSAVPTWDGAPVFIPGRAATLLVAVALLAAAVVSVWRAGVLSIGPAWIPRVGIWVIAVVFAVRAVGDFHYCGFFKRVRGTAFARYDTLVYSPLCAVIAALAIWLSAGG